MKKYLLLLTAILCTLFAFGQSTPTPWGGKNSTMEVLGGLKVDSGLQLPAVDLTNKYKGKGVDTNFRIAFSIADSLPYFMKNGRWVKFVSRADLDSVAAIVGDSAVNIYNSDGTLLGPRTLLGGGFDMSMTGIHHFVLSTTNALDLVGGNGGYININTPLGVTMQGSKVNAAVKTVAYGTRDTILVNDATYDHEFTSGTGASFVYLPTGTSAPKGQEYIIGDAKAISASGSSITIDAGSGNKIWSSRGSSSQTYVININGEIAHLKKLDNTNWLVESGGSSGFDTGTVVGNGTANRLLATNSSGQVITPWALYWDDVNKFFEISHSFRYDSVHHTWAIGDYSAIGNSTWLSIDDANRTFGMNANNGTTLTALTGDVQIVAQNLRNTGGVINSALTFYSFGSTHTMTFSGSVFYDIQYTSGSGAATLNLPLSPPLGTTYIISDLDAVAASNNITLDSGVGNVIVGSSSARTYVMNTNGQVVKLKYVTSGKWKIE